MCWLRAGASRGPAAWRSRFVNIGQIGPRSLALIGVLGTRYHLTQFKIRDLLAQTMGVDFSAGAISQAHGKVAAALKAPVAEAMAMALALALALLPAAKVLHMDETRYPREGSSSWIWAAVQAKLALYSVLPSRARYVINDFISAEPSCIVVSDRYAGLCPHRTRAAPGLLGSSAARLPAHRRSPWAAGASGPAPARPGPGHVPLARSRQDEYGAVRAAAAPAWPGIAACRCADPVPAHGQHLRQPAQVVARAVGLITHPGVEPTNNAAEQALRTVVLKRKISGPTRSRRGDEFIARGYSVVETCRRQGRDALDYLHAALLAFIDKTTPPSLVPASFSSG